MSRRTDNNGFFIAADKVGTFLFTNFIWAVLSMTIIGIPLATVGLFAMLNDWRKGRQPEFFRVFFGAIRQHWRKALLVGLLDLVIGTLLYINLSIFMIMDMGNVVAVMSRTMTICILVGLIALNIYIWSLIPLLDISLKNLLKLSLILMLTYPLRSLAVTISTLFPIVITLFLPVAFILFLTASTTAYIGVRGTWWILQHHFEPADLDELMYNLD